MVQNDEGQVISNVSNLEQGQTIRLQFADGRADADIHTIETKEEIQ
jgi:exonuclease VII large subunit